MCAHHRAIEMRINGPRVDRRFSTTAGGDSDPCGISELFRLLDVSADGWSRGPTGADNSLLLRRRTVNEFDSDLFEKEPTKMILLIVIFAVDGQDGKTDMGRQGPCG